MPLDKAWRTRRLGKKVRGKNGDARERGRGVKRLACGLILVGRRLAGDKTTKLIRWQAARARCLRVDAKQRAEKGQVAIRELLCRGPLRAASSPF